VFDTAGIDRGEGLRLQLPARRAENRVALALEFKLSAWWDRCKVLREVFWIRQERFVMHAAHPVRVRELQPEAAPYALLPKSSALLDICRAEVGRSKGGGDCARIPNDVDDMGVGELVEQDRADLDVLRRENTPPAT
jgi:hypothetical protein